ncbi:MAG: hypothetical protein ACLQLH_08140 [Terracidiphilus sp.]
MFRRSLFLLAFVAVSGLFVLSLAAGAQEKANRGRKYKAPLPTARIEVMVLRDADGKPINNAAVVFHPMEGEQDKGNMELKTNEDGKTLIDVIPIGSTVRLQVIARDFQTYGEDYKVDKPSMAITIRMRRPGEQYSLYETHPANQEIGGTNGEPAMNATQTPKPIQGYVTAPPAQPNAQTGSQPQPK